MYTVRTIKQGEKNTSSLWTSYYLPAGKFAIIDDQGQIAIGTTGLGEAVLEIYGSKKAAQQQADYLNRYTN